MMRTARLGLALIVLSVGVAACESDDGADPGRLRVVASFYPLAEAAEVVGGERVTVDNLTPPGVEPHDLELAPDDLEALVDADVVVYIGGGFQPAVEDGVEQAEGRTLDVLEAAGPLDPPGPAGEEADELEADPHVWLDPSRFAMIVRAVADELSETAPQEAAEFRANADAYVAELEALDEELTEGLGTCERRQVVVNHAAFGYLTSAYGLEQVAISGVSPGAEPNPARLAELRAFVEQEGVTTIFTEELASPEVAETLAEEAGVEVAVLSPIEGLTPEEVEAGDDYLSVMRRNLETLAGALGCT
jgi:zinc transport system substrate-binding protein